MTHQRSSWHRLADVILSTDHRRRTAVSITLLALLLMSCSVCVMLLVALAINTVDAVIVRWWAGISVGGMVVLAALIRAGATAHLRDPSLTIVQMTWALTSGALAYMMAGEARGLIPSVLGMILFFGIIRQKRE